MLTLAWNLAHQGKVRPTPGRFVSAILDAPSGPLRVIGVGIPWYASRVREGGTRNWALRSGGRLHPEAAGLDPEPRP
jgi:hypothetical protein